MSAAKGEVALYDDSDPVMASLQMIARDASERDFVRRAVGEAMALIEAMRASRSSQREEGQ